MLEAALRVIAIVSIGDSSALLLYGKREIEYLFGEISPMNASDLLWRTEWFVSAVSNLIVLGITIESYGRRPRRSVKLIAAGAAAAFLYGTLSWIAETPSRTFWGFLSLVNISAGLLWIAGLYLLLADINRVEATGAEPGAAPNGGPVASTDNSNASDGPPSVSSTLR